MLTALDIVTSALQEINAVAQGEQPEQGDAQFALGKLNDLTDEWAARKCFIYDEQFAVYTLQPGLLPATIGPMAGNGTSSLTNNLATFNWANNFSNGDMVTVFNSSNGLNITGRAQLVSAASFSIPFVNANIPAAVDTGNAILAGTVAPTYATPNLGQRPQRIEQANLILTDNTPNVDVPMNIRDSSWWMSQRVKTISTSVPTDLYYDPDFPNGSLYFWPVPDTAYQVRLKLWGVIPQFPTLSYTFSLPPGYQKALKLDLAFDLVGSFQGSWGPSQQQARLRAIKAVQSNNIKSPRGYTLDAGMPRPPSRADWNYETAMPSGS